jgi:hypothetical protein
MSVMVNVTCCPGRLGSVHINHVIVWPIVALSGVKRVIRVCVADVGAAVTAERVVEATTAIRRSTVMPNVN